MKLNVSNLLTTLAAVWVLTLPAQAQEELPATLETPDPNHREFNLNEDKTLIYERTSSHTTVVKDSVQSTPRVTPNHASKVVRPDASKNNSKDAYDDALSFNFLYYMLQKFKLSDLIDQ